MDKDTLLTSFGKWAAPIKTNIIQDWQHFSTLDRYTKKRSVITPAKPADLTQMDLEKSIHLFFYGICGLESGSGEDSTC